jgi:hypothetical protein
MGKTESPVAEALSRAHRSLLEDLRKLEEAARPSAGKSLTDLRDRLDAADTDITEHFRFEEQNGYMSDVRKQKPHLERAVQQLAAEHRQLAQGLAGLIDKAWAASSLDDALGEEVRQWIERVRQHEHRENELVQDAFNIDIGARD